MLAWVIQDGTEGRQVTCVHRTQPNLHAGMRRTYVRYEVIGIEAGRRGGLPRSIRVVVASVGFVLVTYACNVDALFGVGINETAEVLRIGL